MIGLPLNDYDRMIDALRANRPTGFTGSAMSKMVTIPGGIGE